MDTARWLPRKRKCKLYSPRSTTQSPRTESTQFRIARRQVGLLVKTPVREEDDRTVLGRDGGVCSETCGHGGDDQRVCEHHEHHVLLHHPLPLLQWQIHLEELQNHYLRLRGWMQVLLLQEAGGQKEDSKATCSSRSYGDCYERDGSKTTRGSQTGRIGWIAEQCKGCSGSPIVISHTKTNKRVTAWKTGDIKNRTESKSWRWFWAIEWRRVWR